jgi:hypothetical protein
MSDEPENERGLGFSEGLAELTASGELEKVFVVDEAESVGSFNGDVTGPPSSSSSLSG